MEEEQDIRLVSDLVLKQYYTATEVAKIIAKHDINRLLMYGLVSASTMLETPAVTIHAEIDTIEKCGQTVCVSIKRADWEEAEQDAQALRRAGYKVKIDYESDKPRIIVRLNPHDTIRFSY